MAYKAAIFDMDGTILNTLQDLQNATNYALREHNFPERTYEEVRNFVGNGVQKLIERALPEGSSDETVQSVLASFKTYYKVHSTDTTAPYEGIPEAIKKLREAGIKTAVVSNKPDFGVQDLVKDFFPNLFDVALGEKAGIAKKPAPDMVNSALDSLAVSKTDSVYIGDSDVDFMTAKNSGLSFIGCSWGFKGRSFLEKLGAGTIVDNAEQLVQEILKQEK